MSEDDVGVAMVVCSQATGVVGGIGIGRDAGEVLVTVQGDGVLCYETYSQMRKCSWALGNAQQDFTTATVWDACTGRYYAAVSKQDPGGPPVHTLWSWLPASAAGSLQRISKQLALPSAPYSLSPAWGSSPGAARPPFASAPGTSIPHAPPQPQAMDVEGGDVVASPSESEAPRAGLLLVFKDASVALCTFAAGAMSLNSTAVATGAPGPASTGGRRIVDVAFDRDGGAALVQSSSCGAGAAKGSSLTYIATLHQRQGLTLAEPRQLRLRAPVGGAELLSVGLTPSGLSAFWSDGSLQQYERSAAGAPRASATSAPSKASRTLSKENALVLEAVPSAELRFVRQLRGFCLPSHQAAVPLTAAKKRKGAAANGATNGALQATGAAPALVAVSSNSVAVVGWEDEDGSAATQRTQLRVVAVDMLYGTVTSVHTFAAGKATSSSAQASSSAAHVALQAAVVDWEAGELAVLLDSTVVQLFVAPGEATLASLVGTAAVGATSASARATRRALQPADAAAFLQAAPADDLWPVWQGFGGALAADAALLDPLGSLAVPFLPRWHSEPEVQASLSAAVAAQLAEPSSVLGSAKAAAEFVTQTLTRADQLGEPLPIELSGRLASALAERGHWAAIGTLLASSQLTTLSVAPGLASAAALVGQFAIMSRLLLQSRDIRPAEVCAILRHLLDPPLSARAPAMQLYDTAVAAASAAVEAGERCTDPAAQADMAAAAARAVAAVQGFSPEEFCLHALVASRHDRGLLFEALHGLSSGHAAALLQYLHTWLRHHTQLAAGPLGLAGGQKRASVAPGGAVPSQAAVLQWLSALLDAQLGALVGRSKAAPLLLQLQEAVEAALAENEGVLSLSGAAEHIACRALVTHPNMPHNFLYRIEFLDLGEMQQEDDDGYVEDD